MKIHFFHLFSKHRQHNLHYNLSPTDNNQKVCLTDASTLRGKQNLKILDKHSQFHHTIEHVGHLLDLGVFLASTE